MAVDPSVYSRGGGLGRWSMAWHGIAVAEAAGTPAAATTPARRADAGCGGKTAAMWLLLKTRKSSEYPELTMTTYTDQQHRLVRELHFAEDWGMVFELLALPRMAGRVWATLAMAEEPYLSAEDLENRLEASSGAVNGALQFLTGQGGARDGCGCRGSGATTSACAPGTMELLVARRLAVMGEVRDLAARGVQEFADRPAARARFEEAHDFYTRVDTEMHAVVERSGRSAWPPREAARDRPDRRRQDVRRGPPAGCRRSTGWTSTSARGSSWWCSARRAAARPRCST